MRSSTPLSGRARVPRRARFLLKSLEYVPSARHALRRLEELEPDVVHVQWLGAAPYDVRWLRRLERERATLLTAHDLRPRRRINSRAWAEALGVADRVIVHSESALEELASSGIARARLERIPHPVFDGSPGREPSAPGGHTLLFFGLLRRYKGLDVLLRALPAVAREVPEAPAGRRRASVRAGRAAPGARGRARRGRPRRLAAWVRPGDGGAGALRAGRSGRPSLPRARIIGRSGHGARARTPGGRVGHRLARADRAGVRSGPRRAARRPARAGRGLRRAALRSPKRSRARVRAPARRARP